MTTDDVHFYIRSLFDQGLSEGEIHQLVTTTARQIGPPARNGAAAVADQDLPIYDELPDGLIDLPTAARRHGRSIPTLHQWVRRGYISIVGRLRAPARGGGYLVLRESEIISRLAQPRNRGGRPKKPT